MNSIKCPLCSSIKNKLIDHISDKDLNDQYVRMTGEDFSYLLNSNISLYQCENCNLKFYNPLITGDEKFYNSLQKYEWYYVKNKYEYEFASKYIKSGDIVLDVGCGNGEFAKYVIDKKGKFIGLDFSEKAVELAKKKNIKILNQSISDYSKKNPKTVDLVVSFQVLEHVSEIKNFIQYKLNSLVPGGLMIIAVPSEDSFVSKTTNGILNMPPHHVSRWPDAVFDFISKEFNIELIDLIHEPLQNIHKRWFVASKLQNLVLKPKLIDTSIKRKIIAIISIIFSWGLTKILSLNKINGHTVLAVYKKPNESINS